jgi:hypothetical protein
MRTSQHGRLLRLIALAPYKSPRSDGWERWQARAADETTADAPRTSICSRRRMHQDLNQIRYPVMPFAPHGSDTPARGDEHGGMYIGTINDCQLPPDGIGPGPHAGSAGWVRARCFRFRRGLLRTFSAGLLVPPAWKPGRRRHPHRRDPRCRSSAPSCECGPPAPTSTDSAAPAVARRRPGSPSTRWCRGQCPATRVGVTPSTGYG